MTFSQGEDVTSAFSVAFLVRIPHIYIFNGFFLGGVKTNSHVFTQVKKKVNNNFGLLEI